MNNDKGFALVGGMVLMYIVFVVTTLFTAVTFKKDESERESRPEENIECVTFQGHRSICKLTYKDVELCYIGRTHQAFYVSCDKYEKVKSYE